VQFPGLVGDKKRIHVPYTNEVLKTGDIIIIETDANEPKTLINDIGIKLGV